MMKKILIATNLLILVGTCSNIQANVKVINNLPWKIRFTVHWIGKLPIDGNPFNTRADNWRDSYTFEVPANGTQEEGADAWNIKSRYVVEVWDSESNSWIPKYDEKTTSGGNRKLTVTTKKIDPLTGYFEVDVTDGLL